MGKIPHAPPARSLRHTHRQGPFYYFNQWHKRWNIINSYSPDGQMVPVCNYCTGLWCIEPVPWTCWLLHYSTIAVDYHPYHTVSLQVENVWIISGNMYSTFVSATWYKARRHKWHFRKMSQVLLPWVSGVFPNGEAYSGLYEFPSGVSRFPRFQKPLFVYYCHDLSCEKHWDISKAICFRKCINDTKI